MRATVQARAPRAGTAAKGGGSKPASVRAPAAKATDTPAKKPKATSKAATRSTRARTATGTNGGAAGTKPSRKTAGKASSKPGKPDTPAADDDGAAF